MKTMTGNCKNICFYLLVTAASLAIGYVSLGYRFDFDIYPGGLSGDATSMAAAVKGIQENGLAGMWFNERIGAPELSSTIDATALDLIQSLLFWILSIFITGTARLQYAYFILTFALNAVSMALLLRKIHINMQSAFVCSILFTAAPYHFARGLIGHLALTNYMYVAITVYLSLHILGIVEEEKKDRWKLWFCCIILGFGCAYYYAFGLIVMATAYLISFIRFEDKRAIVKKLWIAAVVLLSVFASLLPKIIYNLLNGKNEHAFRRFFSEQELYGLKIIQLLFPPASSRFEALRAISQEYSSNAPLVTENSTASLGMVASAGFLILCVALVYSFASRKKQEGSEWLLTDFLSLSALVLVLTGTVGGFGEIFNFFVTPQIRCYNRVSIYISGLSLIMIAMLLHGINRSHRRVSYIVCAMVLMVGLTSEKFIGNSSWQKSAGETQVIYEKFFSQAEQQLETGAMVYQLPYLDYPETGPFDYKHFVGYLFTDTLKWSYGGVVGRNEAAKNLNIDNGMSYRFLKAVKDAGFAAVYIDLSGYEDGGSEVLSFYRRLDPEPMISEDGMLYLYDLSDVHISDEEASVGYVFVDKWDDTYGTGWSVSKKAWIASGLQQADAQAYAVLFDSISDRDVIKNGSNEKFIDFLYQAILGREEAKEERDSWVSVIQSGVDREEVFGHFLGSAEFRILCGFEQAKE